MARLSVGPWFRASKNTWYVEDGGKQVSLKVKGLDGEKDAVKAWHRLMAGETAAKLLQPPISSPPKVPAVSVRDVANAFLADVGTRCKPESMAVYKSALIRFTNNSGTARRTG